MNYDHQQEVRSLNTQISQLEDKASSLDSQVKNLTSEIDIKKKDYNILSDSFYRLKKEKESTETENEGYIQSLEDRDKERSGILEKVQQDVQEERKKNKELLYKIQNISVENNKLQEGYQVEQKKKEKYSEQLEITKNKNL